MKSIRLIALSAILTIGSFSAITYTSCSKDECKGVTCLNGGTCSGGTCSCKSGIGGSSCETIYRNLYAYTYNGSATDNTGGTYPNSKLRFTSGSDTTDFTKMSLEIVINGTSALTIPVTLSNITSTGAVFTVPSTTTIDTLTYTGTGTVNGSVATLSLTQSFPGEPAVIFSFTNFIK